MVKYLSPKYFLIGMFIGFIFCCLLGFQLSKSAKFDNYVRIFHSISIANQYFPTVNELFNTAESKIDWNKIIVIVGGSSIFRGVGQNEDEVWTLELQRLLGEKYIVLNFAVDGGSLNGYGSVIYRSLKEQYDKVIYVSTSEIHSRDIDGGERYNHLFWDAYYKNFFHLTNIELNEVKKLRRKQLLTASGFETHSLAFLNSFFYFKDFWNWIGYHIFFLQNLDNGLPISFNALNKSKDIPIDYPIIKKNIAKDIKEFLSNVHMFRDGVKNYVSLDAELFKPFNDLFREVLIREHRNNTVCVIVNENPRHLGALASNYQAVHYKLYNQELNIIKSLGYKAVIVGRDYSPNDFIDARHLAREGGQKAARDIKVHIIKIASEKGYLKQRA